MRFPHWLTPSRPRRDSTDPGPSSATVKVQLQVDVSGYLSAMREASEAATSFARLSARLSAARAAAHQRRHHHPETPEATRLHAAYDRRRRARRRRNR